MSCSVNNLMSIPCTLLSHAWCFYPLYIPFTCNLCPLYIPILSHVMSVLCTFLSLVPYTFLLHVMSVPCMFLSLVMSSVHCTFLSHVMSVPCTFLSIVMSVPCTFLSLVMVFPAHSSIHRMNFYLKNVQDRTLITHSQECTGRNITYIF